MIGTVKGDLHDIGKNLVSIMLEGAGYQIIDLGWMGDAALFLKKPKKKSRMSWHFLHC
jgi:5-methyltetrahydrofolate--homocysteine methyltransferase